MSTKNERDAALITTPILEDGLQDELFCLHCGYNTRITVFEPDGNQRASCDKCGAASVSRREVVEAAFQKVRSKLSRGRGLDVGVGATLTAVLAEIQENTDGK